MPPSQDAVYIEAENADGNIRAVGIGRPTVDVPVDSLVAQMRDAGGGGFIESMLGFCWR